VCAKKETRAPFPETPAFLFMSAVLFRIGAQLARNLIKVAPNTPKFATPSTSASSHGAFSPVVGGSLPKFPVNKFGAGQHPIDWVRVGSRLVRASRAIRSLPRYGTQISTQKRPVTSRSSTHGSETITPQKTRRKGSKKPWKPLRYRIHHVPGHRY